MVDLLPHWQPVLKQPPAWSVLITQARSTLTITFPKRPNLEGNCYPRCTHGKTNVGQSNYSSQSKCASPEGGISNGDAQAIVTQLEPQVPPTMAVKKKSRILWNEEKEKRLMELYVHSSNDPSRGCARRLLEEWSLPRVLHHIKCSNEERVRLIKSRPKTTQVSNSDPQATAEVEESSLPNSPAQRGLEAREGDPYITTTAVVRTNRSSNRTSGRVRGGLHGFWPSGRVSEKSRPSLPPAIERYKLNREKYQMAWGSCGRQTMCSDQPMDERSETQNTLGGQLHGVCCSFNPAPPKISRVCSASQKKNAKGTPRQRWIRRQLRREFHTLGLKRLLSNREETLGKLRV